MNRAGGHGSSGQSALRAEEPGAKLRFARTSPPPTSHWCTGEEKVMKETQGLHMAPGTCACLEKEL